MEHNDNNRPSRLKRLLTNKGFYILLALCLGIMAATGYVTYNQRQAERMVKNAQEQAALQNYAIYEPNVPTMASTPGSTTNTYTSKPLNTPRPATTQPAATPPATTAKPQQSQYYYYEFPDIEDYMPSVGQSTDTAAKSDDASKAIESTKPAESEKSTEQTTKATTTTTKTTESKPVIEPVSSEPLRAIMPAQGEIIANYTTDNLIYSSTMRDWRAHLGTDIKGDIGTPVKAVLDGVVQRIHEDEMTGVTIVLSHAEGYTSVYANLQPGVLVDEGQTVAQGDTIGGMGMTAAFEIGEPPHLHFELHQDGTPVDVATILK